MGASTPLASALFAWTELALFGSFRAGSGSGSGSGGCHAALPCPLPHAFCPASSCDCNCSAAAFASHSRSAASDNTRRLLVRSHEIAAVFAPPDGARGEDPLAAAAGEDGVTVHKFVRYRELLKNGGETVPEVKAAVEAAGADLHVLAFVTLFVPLDICDLAPHGTIVYHPSLLPLHRGMSAINWSIISGDAQAGFTIFYADDGLDTGDIVLQRSVDIGANDTISALYRDWLFPEGVAGIADAVKAIEDGSATRTVQEHRDNSEPPYYDPPCNKPMLIDFSKDVQEVHDLIRGCDSAPGAYFEVMGVPITLLGSSMILGTGFESDPSSDFAAGVTQPPLAWA